MQTLDIIHGNQLPNHLIERMNQQRIHEYGENTKDFRKNEQESIFFFVRDDDRLCAFGMLKPITLTISDTMIDILGIGNIIATVKGEGYGKMLMHHIRDYLIEHERIGMGFCDPSVANFYQKCGYQLTAGLYARYRYTYAAQDGEREQLKNPRHILSYDPNHQIIERLLATDDTIYINKPFW